MKPGPSPPSSLVVADVVVVVESADAVVDGELVPDVGSASDVDDGMALVVSSSDTLASRPSHARSHDPRSADPTREPITQRSSMVDLCRRMQAELTVASNP